MPPNALREHAGPGEATYRFAGLLKALAGINVGMGADGINHPRQQGMTGMKTEAPLHHQSVGVLEPRSLSRWRW